MRKVAEKIVVREEIKTDFIYDMEGRQTDMTYDYKEVQI
jgi:hypothetical protein